MPIPVDLERLLEDFPDAIVASDAANRIRYMNGAAARLLGWSVAELKDRPLVEIMPQRMRPAHDAAFARFVATREGRLLGRPIRVPALAKDGREIPVELVLSAMDDGAGGVLVIAALRDLTARVELEREAARARSLEVQLDVARALVEETTLGGALRRVLATVARAYDFAVGVAWFLEDGALRADAHWHDGDEALARFVDATRAASLTPGEGRPGRAVARGETVWVDDVAVDEGYRRRDAAAAADLHAMLVFPLLGATGPLGALELVSHRRQRLDDELRMATSIIGRQLGQYVERTRAEQARTRAERRLEATLKGIGDAVIVADARARVTFMNPIAEALTGWRAADAAGAPVEEVFVILNETTRAPVESPVPRVLQDGVVVGLANHTVLRAKDGVERAIADSGAPVRDDDGRVDGVVLVFRDETERRRHEQRQAVLASASALLESGLDADAIAAGVARAVVPVIADWCSVEIGTLERRGEPVVAHVDPARVALAAELRRRWPPDPDAPRGAAQVLRTGKPELFADVPDEMLVAAAQSDEHLRLLREVGMRSAILVPLAFAGRVCGVLTLVSSDARRRYDDDDVRFAVELGSRCAAAIENARLHRELREERGRLLEALMQAPSAIAVVSGDDFRYELSNALNTRLLGTDPVGRRVVDAVPELAAQGLIGLMQSVRATGAPYRVEEAPVRLPDGRTIFVNGGYFPIRGSAGEVASILCWGDDVTKHVEARRALEQATRARDDFIVMAAHELRTPLTTMRLKIENAERRIARGDVVEHRETLRALERHVDRLGELVDKMLQVSQLQDGKIALHITDVDLAKVARDVVDRFGELAAKKGSELSVAIRDAPSGPWDRLHVDQVLANLVTNAIKYGESKPIVVEVATEGGDGVVRVRDGGRGVAHADRLRIFERFERAAPADHVGGLGLGLYISKQMIEALGGRIDVEDGDGGRGSTFTVRLPLRRPG